MSEAFVADVGGTNIRLATLSAGKLTRIEKYKCADFANIVAAVQAYFVANQDIRFSAGCLAVAGPVNGDIVTMTNLGWEFSTQQVQAELGLKWLGVLNDFNAVAHSLPVLTDSQKVQIGAGEVREKANIAVLGPGTGLGVDHLRWTGTEWQALDGEGGHTDFAPVDETDLAIWQYVRQQLGRASAEEVLSGRGLVNVYRGVAAHLQVEAIYNQAADISENALNGHCNVCRAALTQFCRILGSFAGNLALNLGTFGGVYIGGGIVPRFVDFVRDSDFRARFEAKGHLYDYVKQIPTFIITEPDHGLIGAAAYLYQNFKG